MNEVFSGAHWTPGRQPRGRDVYRGDRGIFRCIALLLTTALLHTHHHSQARLLAASSSTSAVPALRHAIRYHRGKTWRYQDRAGVHRTRAEFVERRTESLEFLTWVNHLWQRRLKAARRLAARPRIAHEALWLCIHRGEGAWNANTGNGFFGGLQMTSPWGGGVYYVNRADLLSPMEQMRKAELGYRASGYSRAWLGGQWPNTSPPCLQFA